MSNAPSCMLTTKDFTILEVMLDRCHRLDDPLRPILEAKLSASRVVFRDDIPADVVTLSSRVRYRIDDGPAETRIISHDEMRGLVGSLLPITTPRGLALLGLAEGQSFTVEGENGPTMHVVEVVYQPEAARRDKARLSGLTLPRLRLVHNVDGTAGNGLHRQPSPPDFDDPGPSAA